MALVLCCSAAFAAQPSTSNVGPPIDNTQRYATGTPDPQPQVGGEDISTAVNIPGLPYNDGGNTCGFLDNYDAVCPYTGSTAPDVVYAFSPGTDISVDIDLCQSFYDTKVFVYENSDANLIACNDDFSGCPNFTSRIECLDLTAGNTYYIVVDGWSGACGDYILDVVECEPCIVTCPSGAQLENEPPCGTNYVDAFNGGCNSTPNVFSSIACDADGEVTMCGEYGGFTYNGLSYRDTDWYELDPDGLTNGISVTVTGEYATIMGYLAQDCVAPAFVEYVLTNPCVPATVNVPSGNWWLFCSVNGFGPTYPCGGKYNLDLSGYICGPVSVEASSWGQIKGKYTE
jgi:hypothetical protein